MCSSLVRCAAHRGTLSCGQCEAVPRVDAPLAAFRNNHRADKAWDIRIQGKDTSAAAASYTRFSWAAPSCTRDRARAAAEAEGKACTAHFDSAVAERSWAGRVRAWSCSAAGRADRSMADTWAGIVRAACAWDAAGTYTAGSKDCAGRAYCYYAVPPFRAQDCSSFHFFIFSYLFRACHRTSPSPCTARDGSFRHWPCESSCSSARLHPKRVTVRLPLDDLEYDLAGAVGFLFIIAIEMSGGEWSLGMAY